MGKKSKAFIVFLSLFVMGIAFCANVNVVGSITLTDSLPTSIDNSQTPWFPPIALQNHGCTAFSVGYYIKTFQEAKEHNWDLSGAKWEGVTLSNGAITNFGHPTVNYQNEIMSPAFCFNLDDPSGSIPSEISLVCNIGVCTWASMPYDGNNWTDWPSQQAWAEGAYYRGNISTYQYMVLSSDQGINSLKSLLAYQNLASININASALKANNLTPQDFLTTDNYNATTAASTNHVNTIVGYDDSVSYTENGVTQYGAFKVANSYGAGVYKWENIPDGFYWISYAAMQQRIKGCYYFNDLINYKPDLTASFQISADRRSDFWITLSAGSSATCTKLFSTFVSGYPYPYSPSDYLAFPNNCIVVDITEFERYLPSVDNQTFNLSIRNSGSSSATITEYSIASSVGWQEYSTIPCVASANSVTTLSINYTNPTLSPSPTPTPTPSTQPTLTPTPISAPTATPTPQQTPTPRRTLTPTPTQPPTETPNQTTEPTPLQVPELSWLAIIPLMAAYLSAGLIANHKRKRALSIT